MSAPPDRKFGRLRETARDADGFTLLELLVALTLLALILALAFGGLRFGAKAWQSGDRRIEWLSEFQVAHRVVTSILSQAYPLVLQDGIEPRFAFEGTADAVRFVAFMPPYPDVAGPYLIGLRIVRTERGNELRLTRAPFATFARGLKSAKADEDVSLLETSHRMGFSYFTASEGAPEGEWLDRWNDGDRMPARVRLRLVAQDDEGPVWPDLIVRLVINMDSACLVANAEDICRLRK